ncbi:hypothetical protein LVQ79_13395 [Buttiauxella sp. A2-C1_F]|uniref:hypothetical protein n=1 Tax=Buttiauxella sp. A2-C1_F TaxID=2904526 RepID=UPI001E5EB58D|nr:hypothetical protein [Buttiauxella sp. A2-C1_F]MCE0846545.1 hypothetical protein [Buttiauxella sp. A2-C1_F]
MTASDYLRMKYASDRHLALSTQNAIGGVMHTARGVASDIYSGIERASWYSSCFIPQYNDVCQELKAEEIRTIYSIESIFRYRDVIAHMLFLYFQLVCKDVEEGNSEGSARRIIRNIAGVAASIPAAKVTRTAFSQAASLAISQSGFMSKVVAERLSLQIPKTVFALQFYGLQQKSALAARHLKAMYPEYYWVLYQAKLEMLYYFAEPVISAMIKKLMSRSFETLDELSDFIRESYDV